jgi:TolA-binding protein
MNKSILVAFIAISLHINLFSAEPSAFGAGDISNSSPYGLTSKEKVILQNKKKLKRLLIQNNNQDDKVNSLRERIDGIQSILESLNKNSHSNKLSFNNLKKTITNDFKNIDEYEKRLSELAQANAKQIEKINLLTTELVKVVDTINKSYIERKEFNNLVDDVNKFKSLVLKELKSNTKSKASTLSKMSNAKIKIKAKQYYDKKNYKKSIEYYEYLISKKFEPARGYYMLGEIHYYRKKYEDAIAYFKKSASLYTKASYMPVLMLHTAISMDKMGDKSNAKKFYSAVIAKYSKGASAKIARKKIQKIQ